MSSHRAMPTQDFCTTAWDHGDVQPRLLPEARYVSGSAALRHLGSELTTMVPVAKRAVQRPVVWAGTLVFVGFIRSSFCWSHMDLGDHSGP